MQKWELIRTESLDDENLEEMGHKGWELVAVTTKPSGGTDHMFFKQPVEEKVG